LKASKSSTFTFIQYIFLLHLDSNRNGSSYTSDFIDSSNSNRNCRNVRCKHVGRYCHPAQLVS
jgi:hypothetical protein